jgi:hypothetical protein
MFTSAGRKLLDRMLNNNSQQRPTAKKLCSEFASHRWISLAYECGRRGKNELVIEGFRMAIQLFAVENTIWKELGDAYRAEHAFNDASAAYTTAISCGYSDRALMSTMEETLVLAARERSVDSTENLLGPDIERQSQLQALAAFLMENEYGSATSRTRRQRWPWAVGIVFGILIWFMIF